MRCIRAVKTLRAEAELLDPERSLQAMARLRELGERKPARPEPLRVMARYFYGTGEHAEAAELFARAYARSHLPADLFGAGQSLFFLDQEEAQRRFDEIPPDATVSSVGSLPHASNGGGGGSPFKKPKASR